MTTDPTQPMTKDAREAADAKIAADHEAAAAADAPPPDPLARLRATLDALNHQGTLDLHDRLVAQSNAIRAIADLILSSSSGGPSG